MRQSARTSARSFGPRSLSRTALDDIAPPDFFGAVVISALRLASILPIFPLGGKAPCLRCLGQHVPTIANICNRGVADVRGLRHLALVPARIQQFEDAPVASLRLVELAPLGTIVPISAPSMN